MCGFNGIYSSIKMSAIDGHYQSVVEMNKVLKHRGPDYDEVKNLSDTCILGHVRLSIIDVSSQSNQPMTSKCGGYTIVFNGEIYNYLELKNRLGIKTITTGDTEVLLEALATNGIDILSEINGIFSFALYDHKADVLFMARDRFGVKPAYYSFKEDKLYFSSEIKALFSNNALEKKFNEEVLSDFFSFLCVPGDKTFFKDVLKVQPGEVVSFDSKGIKHSSIFAEPVVDHEPVLIGSRELNEEFKEAVLRQSVSDVPLGLFLSGGVDSNGILTALIENNISPAAYTALFEGDYASYSSETDIVDMIAGQNSISLEKVKIKRKAFWDKLDSVIYHQDEPLADPVSIPVYFLSEKVAENEGKVIHVGEGADELFFGYEAWRKLELLQSLQYVQKILCSLKIQWLFYPLSKIARLLPGRYSEAWRRFFSGLPLFWGGTDALSFEEKLKIGIDPSLLYKTDMFMLKSYDKFLKKFKDNAPNKWMTYFDLKLRLPELMLMRVDKMAMAHGVEARVPFLDNNLAQIAWNIPINKKRTKATMKHILKQSFEGSISESILYAKKQGFNAPAEEWCIDASEDVLSEIEHFCKQSKMLSYEGIKILCKKKPRHLWRIYILARWYNTTFN
jgi:asparagine synthase (glutamine-hydrolysing)